jgi:hypothetical protein
VGRRLAAVLAGCLAVPALALAADGEPKKRIVPADQKRAAAVVLKRTDLAAGWKRVSTPDAGDDDLKCPGFDPDESDLTLTGESETEFESTDGSRYLTSFSELYATPRQAATSWSRSAKPALARCIAHFFREGIAKEGGTAAIVRQGSIAFPRVAPRTIALRVATRVSFTQNGETTTTPFTIHLIGVGRGRGDVGILAMGPGNGIPVPQLRAFARLVALRMLRTGF